MGTRRDTGNNTRKRRGKAGRRKPPLSLLCPRSWGCWDPPALPRLVPGRGEGCNGGGRKPGRGGRGAKGPPEPMQRADIPSGKGTERGGRCHSTQTEQAGGSSASHQAQNPGQRGKAAVIDSCQSPSRAASPSGLSPPAHQTFFSFPRENGGEDRDSEGDAPCLHVSTAPGAARCRGVPPPHQCPQTSLSLPPPYQCPQTILSTPSPYQCPQTVLSIPPPHQCPQTILSIPPPYQCPQTVLSIPPSCTVPKLS